MISNMAIVKLNICNLTHFLTFQFMVQLSVKRFLSKFKVCSFSSQIWPLFPHFICGMFSHSEYDHGYGLILQLCLKDI